MLEEKQLEKLLQILNMSDERIEEIQGKFLTTFNQNSHIFKASFTINHLISLNLLTSQQRIISLFLLIQNYKSQGIKKHPFGLPILNISLLTVQPFQRRMIADLIIDSNREKYLNATTDSLFQEEISLGQLQQQRAEIKTLRDQLKMQMSDLSSIKKRQAYGNPMATMTQRKIIRAPEQDEVNQHIIKAHSTLNYQQIGHMRPIPDFLQVSSSQLTWISPGIIADASWDNSGQIQKKISKTKQLIKKGMEIPLTKQQYGEIEKIFESEVNAILYMDIYPQHLHPLIRYNPQTVALFLTKLSNYPILGLYLDTLINLDLSLNIIEVMLRIIKCSYLPPQFFQLFVYKNLKSFMKNLSNDQIKLMRIFSNFIRVLMKNKLLKTEKMKVQLQGMITKYGQFQQIQKLRIMLNEEVQQD